MLCALVIIIVVACMRLVTGRKGMFVAPRVFGCHLVARRYSVCNGSVGVHVGRHSYVLIGWVSNYDPRVKSTIKIGKFCSVNAVKFLLNGDSGHNHDILCSTYHWANVKRCESRRSHVSIGNDVWIGENVTILGGVKVGHGAIVGANALVTRDVAPYTIVGGNPATKIRQRYTSKQIERLLKIKWWNSQHVGVLLQMCIGKSVDTQIRIMETYQNVYGDLNLISS